MPATLFHQIIFVRERERDGESVCMKVDITLHKSNFSRLLIQNMLSLLPFHFIPIQIQFNLFSQYVRSVAQSDFTTPECETWMHLNLARHYLTECFRCFRKYVSVNCTLAQMLIPCIDFILSFWALLCVSLFFYHSHHEFYFCHHHHFANRQIQFSQRCTNRICHKVLLFIYTLVYKSYSIFVSDCNFHKAEKGIKKK